MSSSSNISKRKIHKTLKSNKSEAKEAEEILEKGVEDIYLSFNLINKNYQEKIVIMEKEINNLSQKVETLIKELEMIQRENKYYKENNNKLKNEIEKLNRIVNNIKGKLTNDDLEINKFMKTDNIMNLDFMKFYSKDNTNNKFKNNNNNFYLYNAYKNSIYNENKKNEKNNLIHFYMDNQNESLTYNKEEKENGKNNSSFNLKLGMNNLYHNNYLGNKGKYRPPNTFQNKYRTAHISREEKNKSNNDNDDRNEDLQRDTLNIKNRSNSSNKYIRDKIKNNKEENEESDINNEDLNIKQLNTILLPNNNDNNYVKKNNNKNKKLGQNVCLTYDNLFNNNIKEIHKKKNAYNTFRGKIFNGNNNKSEDGKKINKNEEKEKVHLFLDKCKNFLEKESYEKIVNIFHDYKEGLITDKGIIVQIQKYISNNKVLINLFNKTFSK